MNEDATSPGDYTSPGLAAIRLDEAFPEMVVGNPDDSTWPYLHRGRGHNWYVDRRNPTVGFVNRDEASLLYNNAMLFKGRPCLEIGCWRGWSAAHIAAGSGSLDVIDPALQDPAFLADVRMSLSRAAVADRVTLDHGSSPEAVERLAAASAKRWSFVFIDGDHEGDAPRRDAEAVVRHVAETAMIMFHDLLSPSVMAGLDFLREQGWNTKVYHTMQVMGVAWRGDVTPVEHRPDPAMDWSLPPHIRGYDTPAALPGLAGPPGDALQQLSRKHAELLERLAAVESRQPASVRPDEFDRLHARLLSGVERLTVLSAEREQDGASVIALTASLAARDAEISALQAEHAKALEQSEQLRAALGNGTQRMAELTEQLSLARSEASTRDLAFTTLQARHDELHKLAERLQAKQVQLIGRLNVLPEAPSAVAERPLAEDARAERPPIVIAPVERPPVVTQAPAPEGPALARTMARPRVVLGLLRRGIGSSATARREAALIALRHGVAEEPALALADWMARRRNAFGLLRRTLMGNRAAAERAVLAKLDDAYMRAASRLIQPGGEAYERLAAALEQKMVQLASSTTTERPSSPELVRLRAQLQDQARRHEHDRAILSQLEAAKIADEHALLELRIELATARAQTRKSA